MKNKSNNIFFFKYYYTRFYNLVAGYVILSLPRNMSSGCENIFQNYAQAINDFDSSTTDLVPGLLLFSDLACGSTQFPSTGGSNFVTNSYSSGDSIGSADWGGFEIKSFFLPWTFKLVVMTSNAGRTNQFIGPFFTENTALLGWQSDPTSSANMQSDPVKTITFVEILSWEAQALLPQCMGKAEFIGEFFLSRFSSQTQRCDTFMRPNTDSSVVTWCGPNLNNSECACFKELPEIEAKSQRLGVNLPVICFGPECATQNTYKTSNMLSQPCNLTICQQTINSTPGVINESTDTVFCGGQFFNSSGNVTSPSVTPLPGPPSVTQSDTPFYVWIMLGVSGLLFIVLIYLLFAPKPKHQSSILRQIQKFSRQRRARSAVRPDFGTTYPSQDKITNAGLNNGITDTDPNFDFEPEADL